MNKNIIIATLIIVIYFLFNMFQSTKYNLKQTNKKLKNILIKNQFYIKDLKDRNEELRIRNEEFQEYQSEIEKNNSDCLNYPVDSNIIQLLQKRNI